MRGTGLLVGAVAAGLSVVPGPDRASAVLVCLAQLCAVAVLLLRPRSVDDEGGSWRWWAAAFGVLTVSPLLDLVPGTAPGRFLGLTVVGATPLVYGALVRWNRFRTYVSDPGDWLNGLSAIAAVTGAGLVVDHWFGVLPADWPPLRVQLSLLIFASLLILLGTAVTVCSIGGLVRDPRAWVVIAALAGLTVLSATMRGRPQDLAHAQLGWTLAALAVAAASVPRTRSRLVPATSQAPAVGALVVLAVAVAVLAVDGRQEGWAPTVYAAAAVAGISVRVVRLVRELAQLAESRRQALTDELTGAGNRRALLQALDVVVESRCAAALLLLDVDRFKEVNDRQGHHAGDAVLRRVVTAVRRTTPADAVVTRIGGDEFAVLLPGRDEGRATTIGHAVHDAVTRSAGVGLSVGVRAAPTGAVDPDRLLQQADTAMYAAKTSGGGVSVYDSEVDAGLRDRAALAADVRGLLGGDGGGDRHRVEREVVVHYQPQVDVGTGRVVGVEALVRWQHPGRGLLPPLVFLDLVEEQGLMERLTVHVLRRAVREAAGWQHEGVPLRVSVNLSASSLAHPDLLPVVDDLLAATGLVPGRLVLEVTETTLMADPDLALAVTHGLTRRGVQLSIDDYGTGYSSLAYLTDLPATELKLDRAFTARVLAEPRTAQIVEATVALAHRLGLRVVAEGVEDEATRAVLGGLDVDESQGYLHSRPLPPADFARWLAALPPPAQFVRAEFREV